MPKKLGVIAKAPHCSGRQCNYRVSYDVIVVSARSSSARKNRRGKQVSFKPAPLKPASFCSLSHFVVSTSSHSQIFFLHAFISVKMPVDLLNPSLEQEAHTHKLKRLVQSPNSFFMDIKCPGCFQITTVFSHAQTVVLCGNCNIMLCQPTGGKARLTEGCSYRKKVD